MSNWTTSNGNLVESKVRVYTIEDGIVDVECEGDSLGIVLECEQARKKYVVRGYTTNCDEKIKNAVSVGDVLASINNSHVVFRDEVDTATLLGIIKADYLPQRLRFINCNKISMEKYLHKIELQSKSQKDIYGFTRTKEYIILERQHAVAHHKDLEIRDTDWVQYLKSIGGPENLKPGGVYKPSAELKAMCRRGIPAAFRPLVWQKISLSSSYRREFPGDYFETLLARSSNELPREVQDDIEKDIDRTFPEHDYFESGPGCRSLRRVLQAFAMHKPQIGYCQSLNFVAGTMLLFMEEGDAFWLLVTMVDTLLPHDYYTKSMTGTYVDQSVLVNMVKESFPALHSVIEDAQIQLPLITVQWFMCLFVNTLRTEAALRVWDMFLNEGSKVLFRISMALLKLHESKIIDSAQDPGAIFKLLRDIGQDIVDPAVLLSTAYKGIAAPSMRAGRSIVSSSSSSTTASMAAKIGRTRSGRFMAVPADLTGIGLAHIGPTPSPLEVSLESPSPVSLDSPTAVRIGADPSVPSTSPEPGSGAVPPSPPPLPSTSTSPSLSSASTSVSPSSSSSSSSSSKGRVSENLSRFAEVEVRLAAIQSPRSMGGMAGIVGMGVERGQDDDCGSLEVKTADRSCKDLRRSKSNASFSTGLVDSGRGAAANDGSHDHDGSGSVSVSGSGSGDSGSNIGSRVAIRRSSEPTSKRRFFFREKKEVDGHTAAIPAVSVAAASYARRDYRGFKRADIQRMRGEVRPEIEARFAEMQVCRQKWRENDAKREQEYLDCVKAEESIKSGNI